jgi:uncharacterized protein (TIGR02147 family)
LADKNLTRTQILKQAFDRAQSQNKAFSLRALAKKLDLSPGFLSRVFNGKADLPFERIADFVTHLKMDKLSENRLLNSYSDAKTEKIAGLKTRDHSHEEIMKKYVELGEKKFPLLTRWYLIAMLDLMETPDFSDDPAFVSRRLRITLKEADDALKFLKAQDLMVKDSNGRWTKYAKHIRFPTKESRDLIREYHALLMKKAIHTMETQKNPEDFQKRIIAGLSITSNPAQVEKAMARLNEAMYEVAEILGEGETTEIYHLGWQLFPVTVPAK